MAGGVSELIPVWLVGTTFEPRGSSQYTLRLASMLPDFGFQPIILCQSTASVPARLRKSLTFWEVPHFNKRILGSFGMRRFLREHRDRPPALIHAQRRQVDRVTLDLAHRLDCPYLMTVHDYLPASESLLALTKRLGGIIAVSPSIERDLVVGAGVPHDLVRVIPSGVDLPASPRLPTARKGNQIPIVGTASALEPIKGLTYFLMAAELILSSGHDVEFLIAGSGPDEVVLRRAAQHLDIANSVTFVNYVHEYRQVLETFDVFVMPSLEQGLGTVMLEAMALGKPVVASQVGGIADFFTNGEHALLVPKANHIKLADKIEYLIDNPDKARQLAVNGQRFVRQEFSVERMVRQTAELYREILSSQAATKGKSAVRTPS